MEANQDRQESERHPQNSAQKTEGVTRRRFVNRLVAGTGAAGLAAVAVPPALADFVPPLDSGLLPGLHRARKAYEIRVAAAQSKLAAPVVRHPNNGDEARYANRIGSYSKGLPHNGLGEVDPAAYSALLRAVTTGAPADFEAIPKGAVGGRRLVSPQAGLSFELEGGDAAAFYVRPAPAFASAERQGEMAENYWMALLRDVPFDEYATHPLAAAAASDLSRMSDFRGPKVSGKVTPETLFRNVTPGDTVGPWLSQFFWQPMPIGSSYIEGKVRTMLPGIDYLTRYDDWLSIQRGEPPPAIPDSEMFDPVRRYPRNGRDIAQWVHMDLLYQAYFQAMCCLLAPPSEDPNLDGMAAPFDPNNPYSASRNQEGFTTFGGPHIATLLCEVAARCMKAQWYQKWFVHRTLRPEAYAGRVHNHVTGKAKYPLGADVLGSYALPAVYRKFGTYLLPMAFPEGSPLHPSFGSGHATVAGACVTILKAWFDESWLIPNPVVASPDGTDLLPYVGPPLTLGGELNKLASNVAIGRNIAGVHYRSDAIEAMKLGEAVAITILMDQRALYNEPFSGFTFTRFDGTRMTV